MTKQAHDIRLVAIDLDGTLLNSQKLVCDHAAEALRDLPARGIKVVIASARPPRSVRHIYHALGLDTLQINYNGALIWDEPRQTPVFHVPLMPNLVNIAIAVARNRFPEVIVHCELLDRWYTDRTDDVYTTETGRMFKPDVVAAVDTFWNQPMTKLMFLGDPRTISHIETALVQAIGEHVIIIHMEPELLQIADRRVSKAAALAKVAHHYGLDLNQVMAIGDAPNDVGMLQEAGVGIAMGNAHECVKTIADWIAPSNDDRGVHAALVHYGLCP